MVTVSLACRVVMHARTRTLHQGGLPRTVSKAREGGGAANTSSHYQVKYSQSVFFYRYNVCDNHTVEAVVLH